MSSNNTKIDHSFIHNTLRAKSRTGGEQHLDTFTLASFSAREGATGTHVRDVRARNRSPRADLSPAFWPAGECLAMKLSYSVRLSFSMR